jgi:hypothetical protein
MTRRMSEVIVQFQKGKILEDDPNMKGVASSVEY